MTARSDDPGVSPGTSAAASGGEIWGTWEELLLACAVRKHGTASWDSVAMEMLSRCPPAAADSLTPAGCRLRYRLLRRRFAAGSESGDGDGDGDAASADGCVEELRKLRVAELRREVERYDLSIGSLQSKVERLKEERERSISGEANPPPAVKDDEEEPAEAEKGSVEEEEDDLPGGVEDRVSGGESGRSCKESNSSDLKRPRPADDAGTANGEEAARGEDEEGAGGDADAARESSAVKREQVSGESVAGSKDTAADAEKESSDVQSSASPSRRRDRERETGGEDAEAEADEASAPPPPPPPAAAVLPAAEAEALRAFLESVRTSKPGSVFVRRLESQDDEKYRSTIRRHVDLETVRSRLDGGGAGSYATATEFYRDLLLLCANAQVFYPRGSPEHAAAARTRALVAKHMAKDQPGPSGKAAATAGLAAASKKAKTEADVGSLLEKTAPIIVCRKRSSIAKANAAAATAKEERAEKAAESDKDGEPQQEAAPVVGRRKSAAAAKDKDRAARGPRTSKTRGGLAGRKAAAQNQKAAAATADNSSDSDAPPEVAKRKPAGEKKGAGAGVAKKRNAVNFLNRMKQGGSSAPSTERVSLLETLKLSAAAEQKKAGKGGGEGSKKEPPAGGSGSKKAPPGRRNVGRPPKRAAAPPSPPPPKRAKGGAGGGKRGGRK